ncbi:MAG: fimbrillin family protein, partial [Bacteroidales bacterium]|nr:fimbrillin family protein [Bacteroidales bacterium]
MKRFFILTTFLMTFTGCQSVNSNVTDISPEAHGRESLKAIEFSIKDTSATKSPTPITSLSQFNVTATIGSAGSETSKLSNVVFEDKNKSGVFKSDAVWPSADPGYHFYASNVAMTHNASGQSVTISSIDKDVVCAYLASPSYKVKNDLTFNHILARVGKVSFTNLDLCSNVRLSMRYSGSGTYNLRTGVWSSVGSQSSKELTTSDNDFWIIPGTYDATLTYNDANGNPQSKSLSQNFLAGKVNNISAKLDGSVVVKTEDEYEAPTFELGTISDVPAGGGDSGTPSVTSIGQRKRVKKTLADGTVKYDP